MKYRFIQPSYIKIIFTEKINKESRHPLIIFKCTGIDTGKTIVVYYLAKDNKIHKHKYPYFYISSITSESEVIYEAKPSTLLKLKNKRTRLYIQEGMTKKHILEREEKLRNQNNNILR